MKLKHENGNPFHYERSKLIRYIKSALYLSPPIFKTQVHFTRPGSILLHLTENMPSKKAWRY